MKWISSKGDYEHGDYRIYKDFLLACAAVSLKIPRDVVVHLIEGMTEKRIHTFYSAINLGLASAEYWRGNV